MPIRRLWMVAALWGMISLMRGAPAHAGEVDVTLMWTTPGDDGYLGVATAYDVRYSTSPITEQNFYSAQRYMNVPPPLDPWAIQVVVVKGLEPGTDYYFAVKTGDERGNWSKMSNVAIHTGSLVGVGDSAAPLVFSSPWPNPAKTAARFRLSLPHEARVRVEAFDLTGRRVRLLAEGTRPAGPGEVSWDLRDDAGRPLGPGLYLIRAQLPNQVITRRVNIVR